MKGPGISFSFEISSRSGGDVCVLRSSLPHFLEIARFFRIYSQFISSLCSFNAINFFFCSLLLSYLSPGPDVWQLSSSFLKNQLSFQRKGKRGTYFNSTLKKENEKKELWNTQH